ncbi:MAG: hypothetical protein KTR16_02150 [Acidiferrobacterales bacterium]|nr:hypothetical protein [Acidiferrobacterales bacterium]
MKASIIPNTYEEWRHCIVVECGLELNKRFIEKRISALEDKSQHYTEQFIRRYGEQHYSQVLGWFRLSMQQL